MKTVDQLRTWAAQQKRPLIIWRTVTGYGFIWLDISDSPSRKIRKGLKERIIKGLTRNAPLRNSLLWYIVTDGQEVQEEYQGRYYNG